MPTHYQTLGVSRDASSVEVAAAYREKRDALRAQGADAEALERLNEAYHALSNPDSRQAYDAELPRRVARSRDEDGERRGAPAWLKYGVPAFLLVVILLGWRWGRHEPKPVKAAAPASTVAESATDGSAAAMAGAMPGAPSASTPDSGLKGPRSAQQVFADVNKSVVRVVANDNWGNPVSQGSGVVIGRGEVITNCHVVGDSSNVEIKMRMESYPARVTIADRFLDLCKLSVSGLSAPAATVGSALSLEIGEKVFAIGAPRGLELTISEGIVSSLREVEGGGKLIQTTAPVSPGSSGGGLFDTQARLVGIITFQHREGQNLNFAVPADWISEMQNRDSRPRGSLE